RVCGRCEFRSVIGLMGVGGTPDADRRSALEAITPSLGALLANLSLNEALEFESRFREDVIEHLPLGVIAVDRAGRILTWNRYAEEIMGTSREKAKRAPVRTLPGAEAWRATLEECLTGGGSPAPFECPVKRPDGSAIPVDVNMATLRDAQGGIRGAIVTLTDLSRLRSMEDRIRQLDRLAALGRFASSIAHEIRNPLTGIATGVQYLSRGFTEGDDRQEDVRFILREVTRLNSIVQDLLSATRPRSLTLGPVSISDAAQRSIQSLGTAISLGGVEIRLEGADHWPRALADTDQLVQVFLNLFQNAVNAMPGGGTVLVRVHAAGSAHAPRVAIEISDTGRGIAPEHLPRLFEPFFTTRPKGTGLGLFVAHGIVQRHGGSIEVASELDKGTRFTITLPGAAA
ncbi:MAG TPA: ATP-binding protein, partial [Thermoplasmata archaeon]|nr:ATP-binding protein [Thermoplasmata archaeon]